MLENLNNFYNSVSGFDIAYIIITTLSLIKCYRKGFVLSILAASIAPSAAPAPMRV